MRTAISTPRHAELVSASIVPRARTQRRQTQTHRQIPPLRIIFGNQIDFPSAMPALKLFLPQDCAGHFGKQLVVNETVHGIPSSKSSHSVVAMLPQPTDEVGRYPDIQRAVIAARKDLRARQLLVSGHAAGCAARWMLKQVQHDKGEGSRDHYR
jgi:hypothetical protein